jgi:rubrerythrin
MTLLTTPEEWDECPSCGYDRDAGDDTCPFCGRERDQ